MYNAVMFQLAVVFFIEVS